MSTAEAPLGQICIQLHPGRAPGLDTARLVEACEAIARRVPGIRGFGTSEGDDEGAFLNIVLPADEPLRTWPALWAALLASPEFGPALRQSCLCLCTGEEGWDDYRLLYHFDPAVPLSGDA